jgi:hypothetical protein
LWVLGNPVSMAKGPGSVTPALAVVSSLQLPQWLANLKVLVDLAALGLLIALLGDRSSGRSSRVLILLLCLLLRHRNASNSGPPTTNKVTGMSQIKPAGGPPSCSISQVPASMGSLVSAHLPVTPSGKGRSGCGGTKTRLVGGDRAYRVSEKTSSRQLLNRGEA